METCGDLAQCWNCERDNGEYSAMKPVIVEIYWRDATTYGGWVGSEEVPALTLWECRSIGYLQHEDAQHLRLVQTQTDRDRVGEVLVIDKKWITKRRKIA